MQERKNDSEKKTASADEGTRVSAAERGVTFGNAADSAGDGPRSERAGRDAGAHTDRRRIARWALAAVSACVFAVSLAALGTSTGTISLGGLFETTASVEGSAEVGGSTSANEGKDASSAEPGAENDEDSAPEGSDGSGRSDSDSSDGAQVTSQGSASAGSAASGVPSTGSASGASSGAAAEGGSSSGGGSVTAGATSGAPSAITVSISVDSSACNGGVSYNGTLTFEEGATVYDALCGTGLSINARETPGLGTYVAAIGGLAEFDGGPKSGWTYYVNGAAPDYSCDKCTLKNGDAIRWVYVV